MEKLAIKTDMVVVMPEFGIVKVGKLYKTTVAGCEHDMCPITKLPNGPSCNVTLNKVQRNARLPLKPDRAIAWLESLDNIKRGVMPSGKAAITKVKDLGKDIDSGDMTALAAAIATLCPTEKDHRIQGRSRAYRRGVEMAAAEIAYVLERDWEDCIYEINQRLGALLFVADGAEPTTTPAPAKAPGPRKREGGKKKPA